MYGYIHHDVYLFPSSRSRLRLAALKLVLTPAFEVVVIVACVLIYIWIHLYNHVCLSVFFSAVCACASLRSSWC